MIAVAGSTIPEVCARLIDLVTDRVGDDASVLDMAPNPNAELIAPSGDYSTIYPEGSFNVEYTLQVMTGGPLWIDEQYTLPVVCQSFVQPDNDLAECRRRVAVLVHAVLGAVAQSPALGLVDTAEREFFHILPGGGGPYLCGVVPDTDLTGVRQTINLSVSARLKLQ